MGIALRLNIDGSFIEPIVGISECQISWSSDGNKAVYQFNNTIWIMDANGQNKRLLIEPSDGSLYKNPVFSPNPGVDVVPKKIATDTPSRLAEPKPSATTTNSGSCTEAPRPRIFVNALVKVIATNDDRLVLRSEPSISSSTELQRLNYGTELKVHDGPICVIDPDLKIQYWFWEVKVKSSGQMGWVAEGDRILYYLEVIR